MSRLLMWVVCLLPTFGLALFILGVIGDLRGWCRNFDFTVNVAAGTVGAFFGVSLSFFMAQRQAQQQEAATSDAEFRQTYGPSSALLDATRRLALNYA